MFHVQLTASSTSAAAHSKSVLDLSASGPIVASSGYDGAIRLWDVSRGHLKLLHEEQLNSGPVFSVVLTRLADGALLLGAGSYCRRLRVWQTSDDDAINLRLRWLSTQHTGWCRALAVAKKGSSPEAMYSVGCNRVLGWSLLQPDASSAARAPPRTCDGEVVLYEDAAEVRSHDIYCLAHGDDEEALAAGSVDGALRTWSTCSLADAAAELPSRRPDHWIGHDDRVAAVAWQGGQLMSAGYDGWVRSWRRPSETPREAHGDSGGGGSRLSGRWDLSGQVQVTSTAVGRALCLASSSGGVAGGAPASGPAPRSGDGLGTEPTVISLCGTSDGELVALRAASSGLEAVGRLGLGGVKTRRVTAAVGVPAAPAHGEDDGKPAHTFVVGDSEGNLHFVQAVEA